MIGDKIQFSKDTEALFLELSKERGVELEGNILKVLESSSGEFKDYISNAIDADSKTRRKRLQITKQIQTQNKELEEKASENDALMLELKEALDQAEGAKASALNDLDLLQRKTQFELIGNIVKVALWIIMAVGLTTTVLYIVALSVNGPGPDTTLIGNAWSNLLGILLTNSFSIIGTIMGVKYASDGNTKKDKLKE